MSIKKGDYIEVIIKTSHKSIKIGDIFKVLSIKMGCVTVLNNGHRSLINLRKVRLLSQAYNTPLWKVLNEY